MRGLAEELAKFVIETEYEDLPEAIVHQAKRTLLDSIGCALAGIKTDKGKISVDLARRLGGPPESSIIGVGGKVSCTSAAFANGELINAMDYDTLHIPPGHVSLYVIPPPLALAESLGASGRDLILATVLGHEISARISCALTPQTEFIKEGPDRGEIRSTPVHGYSQCIFGGAAGAGKILHLDVEKMTHAFGLAGHFCPVPAQRKWEETTPSAWTRYGSAGWISVGGVITALLASMGYVGDRTVFDGEYGFWRFFASEKWEAEKVMTKIGEKWFISDTLYRFYPASYPMQCALDCFTSIIDQNNIMPEDIDMVKVFGHALLEKPVWQNREVLTQVDAQISAAYVIAVAAHRVRVEDWQDWQTVKAPKIREFMKKVKCQIHPQLFEIGLKDPGNYVGRVEVTASFISARQVRQAIDKYVAVYNPEAAPFEWHKRTIAPTGFKKLYADLCK